MKDSTKATMSQAWLIKLNTSNIRLKVHKFCLVYDGNQLDFDTIILFFRMKFTASYISVFMFIGFL